MLGLSPRGNSLPNFIGNKIMSETGGGELREKIENPLKFQWGGGGGGPSEIFKLMQCPYLCVRRKALFWISRQISCVQGKDAFAWPICGGGLCLYRPHPVENYFENRSHFTTAIMGLQMSRARGGAGMG